MANKIKLRRGAVQHKKGQDSPHCSPPALCMPAGLLQKALSYHQAGLLSQAEALYGQVLLADPTHPDALHFIGMIAHQVGKSEIAVDLINKALRFRSDYPLAHNNLGNVLHHLGKLADAVASFRRAIICKPDYVEAHYNLGSLLQAQGKFEEARVSYYQALSFKPDYAEVHYNLGFILQAQGKPDKAIASFRQAILCKSDYAEAHYNLGVILQAQGNLDEAITSYRLALKGNPEHAEAHNNLGIALGKQGKLDEAIVSYRLALTCKSDFVEAHCNLANTFKDQGRLAEAIATYRSALAIMPEDLVVQGNLLLCMNYDDKYSGPLYLDEARHYGRTAAGRVGARFSEWNCAAHPQRLRVGLVSGDFRKHPVGYFLDNMLSHLDPEKIELIAYPTFLQEDELSSRIRQHVAAWRPLVDQSDESAARMIHADGVHLLLDLSGHTAHNRLPIFAWRPAPAQVTWLGYFASTGMEEIDYLLADLVSIPKTHHRYFTETVWYLPEIRYCFSPPAFAEDLMVTPLPALNNGYLTFGCFQTLAKVNDEVLAAWGRIFQAIPQARLRFQSRSLNSPVMCEHLRERLARSGIAPERVMLAGEVSRKDYLAAHSHIDTILDTFPFPGGTTTCEALWMGVPTVTLAGNSMLARQGASILTCVGLADWIAEDGDDYVAKVVAHTSDLAKLARLRVGLRDQVQASLLFDASRFSRNFEEAMWGMWRRFLDMQ